jgi:phosphoglycolate phosphatase-like HAD superfamily hydrolase
MMSQEAVILSDLDGTLLEVRERFAIAQAATLLSLGYKVPVSRLRSLYRFCLDAEKLLDILGISLTSEELHQYYVRISNEFLANWQRSKLIPGVKEAFENLKSRTKTMRIITSRREIQKTREEVHKFGLDRIFDGVFTRGDLALVEGVEEVPLYPFLEHRQRLIQLALGGLVLQSIVWVIGDSPAELEAAKGLGFFTVGVLTGFADHKDLEPFADHILDSAADIGQII